MDITLLTAIAGLLVALSIASERLVEIIKGYVPSIDKENPDPTKEGRRKSNIQILAVISGMFTTYISLPMIKPIMSGILSTLPDGIAVLALGLLASGGSGFWNAILGYVTKAKDIKKLEVDEKKNK